MFRSIIDRQASQLREFAGVFAVVDDNVDVGMRGALVFLIRGFLVLTFFVVLKFGISPINRLGYQSKYQKRVEKL